MKKKYLITANVEHQGAILNLSYESDDESQAVNYFNELEDYYIDIPTKLISIKKWHNESYLQIKIAS